MTGELELTVLALRVALIVGLYLFVSVVLIVVWRDSHATDGAAEPSERASAARLVVVDPAASGLALGVEFTLASSGTIGRGAPSTIMIPDAAVSARHGRVAFRHGGWWVEDLQSANGTYVNGNRVEAPTPLEDGDELEVAQVRLRMEIT